MASADQTLLLQNAIETLGDTLAKSISSNVSAIHEKFEKLEEKEDALQGMMESMLHASPTENTVVISHLEAMDSKEETMANLLASLRSHEFYFHLENIVMLCLIFGLSIGVFSSLLVSFRKSIRLFFVKLNPDNWYLFQLTEIGSICFYTR